MNIQRFNQVSDSYYLVNGERRFARDVIRLKDHDPAWVKAFEQAFDFGFSSHLGFSIQKIG